MRKTFWFLTLCMVAALTAATMITSSCSKNLFDKETADTMKLLSFHNDQVDPNHTWSLMKDGTVRVKANVSGVRYIHVLSHNPYAAGNQAEIIGSRMVKEGEQVSISYSMPTVRDSVYIAAVTTDGQYTVIGTTVTDASIRDFSTGIIPASSQTPTPELQQVYYCYDTAYPEPSSTWAYNDLVMRIGKEYIDDYSMRISVTLMAIATTKQVAAALRLNNVRHSQVYSVQAENGTGFTQAEDRDRFIITEDSLLLTARDGSPVINLFDDAHAAFYAKTNANGTVYRYRFNVTHDYMGNTTEFSPVTVSYIVTFREPGISSRLSYADFDPFVAYYYNTFVWEVHKFAYKYNESLFEFYEGNENAYADHFPWALEVPYRWFRYPSYGNSMGSYKNGVLYGAYQRMNHSFGEWGSNQSKSQDWYLYPTGSMVY